MARKMSLNAFPGQSFPDWSALYNFFVSQGLLGLKNNDRVFFIEVLHTESGDTNESEYEIMTDYLKARVLDELEGRIKAHGVTQKSAHEFEMSLRNIPPQYQQSGENSLFNRFSAFSIALVKFLR